MEGIVWDSVIETIDGDSSCMPTGLGLFSRITAFDQMFNRNKG